MTINNLQSCKFKTRNSKFHHPKYKTQVFCQDCQVYTKNNAYRLITTHDIYSSLFKVNPSSSSWIIISLQPIFINSQFLVFQNSLNHSEPLVVSYSDFDDNTCAIHHPILMSQRSFTELLPHFKICYQTGLSLEECLSFVDCTSYPVSLAESFTLTRQNLKNSLENAMHYAKTKLEPLQSTISENFLHSKERAFYEIIATDHSTRQHSPYEVLGRVKTNVHRAWIDFLQNVNVPAVLSAKESAEKYSTDHNLKVNNYYTGKISLMYINVNLHRGMEIILHTKLKYKEIDSVKEDTVTGSIFADFQKKFINDLTDLSVENGQVTTVSNQEKVYFLITLYGRWENFNRFLRYFNKISNAHLIVALFGKRHLDFELLTKDDRISVISFPEGLSFSRGIGLNRAAQFVDSNFKTDSHDPLLFIADVDLIFDASMVDRIRKNTRKRECYFPIFFSEYVPNSKHEESIPIDERITESRGFWRYFSYGMASIYLSDFVKTGGYDENIKGWGLEDLDFVNKILNKKIQVFKAPDKGLFHIWHDKICDKKLSSKQYKSCIGSRSEHLVNHLDGYHKWLKNNT